MKGLSRWHSGKESAWQCRRHRLISGSGRCPRGGNGNPFQYSCLESPMDRGVWWVAVHSIAKVRHNWATEHTKGNKTCPKNANKSGHQCVKQYIHRKIFLTHLTGILATARISKYQFIFYLGSRALFVVHLLSCVQLFATPWAAAYQASLSFTISGVCADSCALSQHLILCCPLLLLPSIFSSIRVFSNSTFYIKPNAKCCFEEQIKWRFSYCCLVAKLYPNALQPHGLQPGRLLCPWDFPSKNMGNNFSMNWWFSKCITLLIFINSHSAVRKRLPLPYLLASIFVHLLFVSEWIFLIT